MPNTPDELAAISKMIEGMEQRIESKIEKTAEATEQRLEKKIESAIKLAVGESEQRIMEEVGGMFEKTWELIDKNKKAQDDLEERVTALEEQTGITHKN